MNRNLRVGDDRQGSCAVGFRLVLLNHAKTLHVQLHTHVHASLHCCFHRIGILLKLLLPFAHSATCQKGKGRTSLLKMVFFHSNSGVKTLSPTSAFGAVCPSSACVKTAVISPPANWGTNALTVSLWSQL